jgi:hypothetical protein
MDFDTHGLGLNPVEALPSFDASLLSSIIHRDDDHHDMTDWHFDIPDDLPIYDANAQAQLQPDSLAVDVVLEHPDDPMHGINLSRFHPACDDDILYRCLPVRGSRLYALVDRDLHAQLNRRAWRLQVDNTGESYRRYIRRGSGYTSTVYLHREVVRLHLLRCPEYRRIKCLELGVKLDLPVEVQIPMLLSVGVVHHLNHDTEDNRLANLDLVAKVDNRRQTHARPSPTGFRGVILKPNGYVSRVQRRCADGRVKGVQIGVFTQPELAALARCLYLLVHWRVWFVKAFTPTAAEERLWQNVVNLVREGSATHFNWQEQTLPQPILILLVKAREDLVQGTMPKVQWRG